MREQQQGGKARMIGYAIGIAVAIGVILWRIVVQ
jgi:hypothetical protein